MAKSSYAENYSSSDQRSTDKANDLKNKATDVAQTMSKEASTLVDQVVAYTKANPVEAAAIAAGIAFYCGCHSCRPPPSSVPARARLRASASAGLPRGRTYAG